MINSKIYEMEDYFKSGILEHWNQGEADKD